MREVVDAALGAGNADLAQEIERPGAGGVLAEVEVEADGLDQLVADREERVQAGQRVLEDGADASAADLLQPGLVQLVDALAADADLARGDAPRRLEQAQHRHAGHRLAGTTLADDAQDLAGRDAERDVVDRGQEAGPGRKLDPEVLDVEHRLSHRGRVSDSCCGRCRRPAGDPWCGPDSGRSGRRTAPAPASLPPSRRSPGSCGPA